MHQATDLIGEGLPYCLHLLLDLVWPMLEPRPSGDDCLGLGGDDAGHDGNSEGAADAAIQQARRTFYVRASVAAPSNAPEHQNEEGSGRPRRKASEASVAPGCCDSSCALLWSATGA